MKRAAIVTGAAGALGRAIAQRLAHDFDAIVLTDLPSDALANTGAAIAHATEVSLVEHDVTAPTAAAALTDELTSQGWQLAALVNNAGINRDARAMDMTAQEFRAVLAVDLVAPLQLAQGLHPLMGDGAAVVNIASRAALGNFGQTNYVAAKSGLITATRALALSWAPKVRVNVVAPGLIDTPMTAGMPEQVLDRLVARVPAARIGQASEVADLVAYSLSPTAAYVTGQLLICCGGRSIAA